LLCSVTLFGDQLNAINITGISIVFFGVILYKVVFHLEKAEREQGEAYLHVNARESGEDTVFEDEPVAFSDRATELVARSTGKHPQSPKNQFS
jgi:hypothetical protein